MQFHAIGRRAAGIALVLAFLSVGGFVSGASAAQYPPTYPDGRYCPYVIEESVVSRYIWQNEYRKSPNGYMTQVWGHYKLQVLVYSPFTKTLTWGMVGTYKERLCAAWYN